MTGGVPSQFGRTVAIHEPQTSVFISLPESIINHGDAVSPSQAGGDRQIHLTVAQTHPYQTMARWDHDVVTVHG